MMTIIRNHGEASEMIAYVCSVRELRHERPREICRWKGEASASQPNNTIKTKINNLLKYHAKRRKLWERAGPSEKLMKLDGRNFLKHNISTFENENIWNYCEISIKKSGHIKKCVKYNLSAIFS